MVLNMEHIVPSTVIRPMGYTTIPSLVHGPTNQSPTIMKDGPEMIVGILSYRMSDPALKWLDVFKSSTALRISQQMIRKDKDPVVCSDTVVLAVKLNILSPFFDVKKNLKSSSLEM